MTEVLAPLIRNGQALGENIFVYSNIITKQVIYSLTKNIVDKQALKQLTFVGKKSVPSQIRKDIWLPIARVSFPQPTQGLRAYRTLREFRKRHEYEWPVESMRHKKGGHLLCQKSRTRALMNQKANSIADMAATLHIQAEMASKSAQPSSSRGSMRSGVKNTSKSTWPRVESVDGVTVAWANIEDATYAKDWPTSVKHYTLERNGKMRMAPAPSEFVKPEYADNVMLKPQTAEEPNHVQPEEIQAREQPPAGGITSLFRR